MNIRKIFYFLKSRFFDQKKFIYLSLNSKDFKYSLVKSDGNLEVLLAKEENKTEIIKDLYPYFDQDQEYFKQFLNFDREDILCYLGKRNDKIVHYFLVFTKAMESPLTKTKFRNYLGSFPNSAYLGNVFTIPKERGSWIVLQVLSKIIKDLQDIHGITRLLVLIHPDTRGALKFYERLGFQVINFK